jgi:hypothetical protein
MRELNNHIKEVIGIKEQPKPSPNPKNWNWVAIITWGAIFTIAYHLMRITYNLIF